MSKTTTPSAKDLWPFEYANAPSYKTIPYDGASISCQDCEHEFDARKMHMYITYTPDGRWPRVFCQGCICEDWLAKAKNLGEA
jgi:hypothetical protein